MTKHPHHDVIVAFLEGKVVQRYEVVLHDKQPHAWVDYSMNLDSSILPSFVPTEQWRVKPVVERRWYVHDRADTLGDYVTAAEAARCCEHLVRDGLDGIHMIYATAEEQTEYCRSGKFPFVK